MSHASNGQAGRSGGLGIKGVFARPAPSLTVVPEEEELNGLEKFVAWDDLEDALNDGEFEYKADFKAEVISQFEQAKVKFTRSLYESVIAGLVPEAREIYNQLPSAMPHVSAKLNPDLVREIRKRAANGEKALHLAVEYGVRHNTLSDLINNKTWRNVA